MKKGNCGGMKNALMNLFKRGYQKIAKILRIKKNPVVEGSLLELHPLKNQEDLYEEYQAKKLALITVIILLGIVFVVCLHMCSRPEGRLTDGALLTKNEWGGGDYAIVLEAFRGDWTKEIVLHVRERQLTRKESEEMFRNIRRSLPEHIKGNNQDLFHVKNDLNLVTSLPQYPAVITWNSSSERIERTGKIDNYGLAENGEWIELTAVVSYGQQKESISYEVFLLPEELSVEERFFRKLENAVLLAEEEGINCRSISLPKSVEGQEVFWKEIQKNDSIYLILLVILGAVFAGKSMDKDLEKNRKEREHQLLLEYPDFVGKLRLYLSAGMTVKNVFVQLAEDYQQKPSKSSAYLRNELLIACNQFQNNVPEERVYEDWGRRCVEMRYRRLSLLLITHLKQGNGQMLKFLAAEEESAREDRKLHARKLGEEAGTKLLLPMLLQLLIVMFLILIPAYMDFSSV